LLVLLVLAPVIIRLAESRHLETLARSIAYIGYLWMAFVFLFFFLDLALNLSRNICKFFSNEQEVLLLEILSSVYLYFFLLFLLFMDFMMPKEFG